jgi:hypothetical protein
LAIANLARFSVVDAVAVAKIETVGGAKPPNGMLNEPGKIARKTPVKGSGVDPLRQVLDDVGATALGITGSSIGVRCAATFQNAGPVQEIVDEGVNGHHGLAGLEPDGPLAARAISRLDSAMVSTLSDTP